MPSAVAHPSHSTAPAHSDEGARTVTIPRLDLPKFEFRGPVLRPESPAPAVYADPVRSTSLPHSDHGGEPSRVAAVAVAATATATATPIPVATPMAVATVDPTRMEKLRGDAMLGLVIGIGFAVIAAATIVAMWSKLHGVPPGTY